MKVGSKLGLGPNEKNVKKCDANGYYKVNFGVLNGFSRTGRYYKVTDLEALTNKTSVLGRRLYDGILRSEYEHPVFTTRVGKEAVKRCLKLDFDRICGHIREIEFEKTSEYEKGFSSFKKIKVWGWVKPSGPYGKYLKEALENNDENVSFSIRCIFKNDPNAFGDVVIVNMISTFDFVFEHGVKTATSWNAVGIENLDIDKINEEELHELEVALESNDGGCPDGDCVLKMLKENKRVKKDINIFNW